MPRQARSKGCTQWPIGEGLLGCVAPKLLVVSLELWSGFLFLEWLRESLEPDDALLELVEGVLEATTTFCWSCGQRPRPKRHQSWHCVPCPIS
jgi:hypothetical protein